MTLEYLKKNRWTLLKQSIVLGVILMIIFLAVVAILLLSPVGLGFLALLSVNPVGFFFLFVLGLCFLSMAGSVAWLLMSEKSAVLTATLEGENNMCDEKKESNQRLLSNGFNPSDSDLALSILDENETKKNAYAKGTGENTRENKIKKNRDRCPTLEEYSQQSEQFISDARAAIFHNTIKTPKVFNGLEEQFNTLKKTYYQLARNLHPDKNPQIEKDAFKELGNYYENITEMFERLKTLHQEKDIWELLRRMDEELESINKNIKKCRQILNEVKEINRENKKYLAEMREDIAAMKEHNEAMEKHNEAMEKHNEAIKKKLEEIENLYDQGAIDTSNPELQQQLALFSATFYANRDMSEQKLDEQKTDMCLDIIPQNEFNFFSKVSTTLSTFRDWISGIKKSNTCTNPKPITENSDASELDKINASPRLYSNDT